MRLHCPAAGELARSVNARAFTLGDSIVLGSGQYAPGASDGRAIVRGEKPDADIVGPTQSTGIPHSAVIQRQVKTASGDKPSSHKKYSFWWWIDQRNYEAAFNQFDREVQRAGIPIARYIGSYFVDTANKIETAATGIDPETRKPVLFVDRLLAAGLGIADILSMGAAAKLKSGKLVIQAATGKDIRNKIFKAVFMHHKYDLLSLFLSSAHPDSADSLANKLAPPDATRVAPQFHPSQVVQNSMLPKGYEEEKKEQPRIQRAASADSGAGLDVSGAVSAAQRSGAPLAADIRSFFEPRFGHDFSSVRVHTDGEAARAARGTEARAYTLGRDIVFGAHEYAPGTVEGRRLLAHELTHVVQQEGGVRRAGAPVQRSATDKVLQRAPAPQQATPQPTPPQQAKPKIKFQFGWLVPEAVETNEQVAAVARLTIISLKEDLGDVSSDAVKTQVNDWIATVKGTLPYFDRHAGEKVDPAIIPFINYQYDELLKVREAVRQDKLIQIKEALWREHDAAVKAAEEAEALQPALDDALRAAFRKGSSSTVKEAVSTVKGAISVGGAIRSLAAGIITEIMGLPLASGTQVYVDHWTSQIGRPKITIINVGKHTETLGKLGRGLSALNLALTITDRSKKATEAEQGMKDISDAVSIGTDLISVTPWPAPPHFSLYSTLYLKPALKVIGKQIGLLVESLSDVNRTSVEVTGNLMYPNVEPGGQEMFDLMLKVMHAGGESEVPALPSSVQKYLFDQREKLSIGAESNVPTEGLFFWKSLDGVAGRRWLFANRKRVWAMFYGSMKVPDGKH
ncbi:MAG: eCIS core domain-containing protein [Thermoanaerobaculia bacterium]